MKSIAQKHDIYLFYMEDAFVNEHVVELMTLCKEVHPFCRTKISLRVIFEFICLPYTAITRQSQQMKKEIIECIKKNNISLVNVEFPQMCINLKNIRHVYNGPVIVHQHNIEWMRFKQMAESSKGIKKLLLYWESIKLKYFEQSLVSANIVDYYTFLSIKDKEIFNSFFDISETRTKLIPLGADDYTKEILFEHEEINIMFCAAMDAQMNVEAAIWFAECIFPIIEKQIEHVKFYIVGREPVEEVKNLAGEHVIVTGTVDSLDEYYNLADLVVIPLLHGGGVKVKLLEAIGRRKRIVTTSVGIEGTSFLPNIHIPVADKPEDFAGFCVDVLMRPILYEEMYDKMYKLFEQHFTWDAIGNLYLNILENIVEVGRLYE